MDSGDGQVTLPLGTPWMRRVLDRIQEETVKQEAQLAMKDKHKIERDELEERQRYERELMDRR